MKYIGKMRRVAEIICNHLKTSFFVLIAEKDTKQRRPEIFMSNWFGAFLQGNWAYHAFERFGREYFPKDQQCCNPPLGYEHAGCAQSSDVIVVVAGENPEFNQILANIFLWLLETSGTLLSISMLHPTETTFQKAIKKDQQRYGKGEELSPTNICINILDEDIPAKGYFIQHTIGEKELTFRINLAIRRNTPAITKATAESIGIVNGKDIITKRKDGASVRVSLTELGK